MTELFRDIAKKLKPIIDQKRGGGVGVVSRGGVSTVLDN